MVEGDASDDRENRLRGVGGVESPAQSDLEHRQVRAFAGTVDECRRGERLEVGGRRVCESLAGRDDLRQDLAQTLVGDRHAIDTNSLVDALQVGGGEEAGAIPGRACHRRQQTRGGALAVGAGDQHHRHLAFGVPQRSEQLADPVQTQLDPEVLQAIENRLRTRRLTHRDEDSGETSLTRAGSRPLLGTVATRASRLG